MIGNKAPPARLPLPAESKAETLTNGAFPQ